MSTNGNLEIHEFPPKTDDVFHEFRLEECLKRSTDCVVFVCHPLKDSSLKFVTKIGIKREAHRLGNEIKCYKDLGGGDGIPQLIYNNRFVKRRFV